MKTVLKAPNHPNKPGSSCYSSCPKHQALFQKLFFLRPVHPIPAQDASEIFWTKVIHLTKPLIIIVNILDIWQMQLLFFSFLSPPSRSLKSVKIINGPKVRASEIHFGKVGQQRLLKWLTIGWDTRNEWRELFESFNYTILHDEEKYDCHKSLY